MVTKMHGKLHFEDLEPGRFEMLAMQIVYRMRRWERLDHYGAAGSDDGVDINAVELLENGKRNSYHFQCKRYDKLTKSQLEKIVRDYVRDNPDEYSGAPKAPVRRYGKHLSGTRKAVYHVFCTLCA